ncbi:TerB family tellurite resistance protein [Chondromyces crocatus]|uniref:DNA-binding protein n=1 Tax=Chondromyces crocatus TaxID=52 RepID=A0A0K1EQU4_CHOCO|nr:TerB family tellurite resistance protein [Chondromyces crocatus]AKT43022.1 DNA-binding protein [Chondromyces crocatus]
MGLLSWLGLQRESSFPNLGALLRELRQALPDDEAVVLRYIAIVVVLLGKVACADGRFSQKEEELLRALLAHVEGLSPGAIDAVCSALEGKLPSIQEQELDRCYRELKALCDADERARVVRLLIQLAAADGAMTAAEVAEIERIAEELGVALEEIAPDLKA